jgi:hypothetical protein
MAVTSSDASERGDANHATTRRDSAVTSAHSVPAAVPATTEVPALPQRSVTVAAVTPPTHEPPMHRAATLSLRRRADRHRASHGASAAIAAAAVAVDTAPHSSTAPGSAIAPSECGDARGSHKGRYAGRYEVAAERAAAMPTTPATTSSFVRCVSATLRTTTVVTATVNTQRLHGLSAVTTPARGYEGGST